MKLVVESSGRYDLSMGDHLETNESLLVGSKILGPLDLASLDRGRALADLTSQDRADDMLMTRASAPDQWKL